MILINNEHDKRIALYVLNNYIKFERKLYQFAGLSLGRPIRIRTALYVLGMYVIIAFFYLVPFLNVLIRWVPVGVLITVPIGIGILLSDLGTEGRSPIKYFRSFFLHQFHKLKGSLIQRDKQVAKLQTYSFANSVSFSDFSIETDTKKRNKKAVMEHVTEKKSIFDELQHSSTESEQFNDGVDISSYLFGDSNTEKKESPSPFNKMESQENETADQQEQTVISPLNETENISAQRVREERVVETVQDETEITKEIKSLVPMVAEKKKKKEKVKKEKQPKAKKGFIFSLFKRNKNGSENKVYLSFENRLSLIVNATNEEGEEYTPVVAHNGAKISGIEDQYNLTLVEGSNTIIIIVYDEEGNKIKRKLEINYDSNVEESNNRKKKKK